MTDDLMQRIREVDPCPAELSPPAIETVIRRLGPPPPADEPPRWRRGAGSLGLAAAALAGLALAAFVIVALGRSPRATRPAALVAACRPQITDGVLPTWARAGFSDPRPRMPYSLGASGQILAILWGPLDAPPSPEHANKINWVSHVPVTPGANLDIRAQRMAGTSRLGSPVTRVVAGGPAASIIDLPAAGCWRVTLRWSGHTDHMDLSYAATS